MSSLWRKVCRDLAERRIRTALTILGVAVGVAGLVAIVSTSRNITRAQQAIYGNTSQADITYWVWEAPANLIPFLQADDRIAAAELRLTHVTRWRAQDGWMDIELVGVNDFERVRLNRFNLLKGSYPAAGQILLESADALASGLDTGAEVAVRDPSARERYLTISGLSASPSYLSSAITKVTVGYVPASMLRRMLNLAGNNQLLIKLHDSRDAQDVAERVSRLLRRQGIQAAAPEIRQPDNFTGKRELDALIMVMYLFSGLGLVLSALLIANTLSASVAEQMSEIGIMKAIGATRGQVLVVYLIEALAYGLSGVALGLAGGVALGWRLLAWIGSLTHADVRFYLAPEALMLGSAVGLGVALGAGASAAWRGAGVRVKEALESYGIASDYAASWLDRILERKRTPPLAAMAARNLKRRWRRSALPILVIALATAAFLSASSTRDSVNAAIGDIYRTYDADVWVSLNQEVSVQLEERFLAMPTVRAAEGWVIANGVVGLAEARLWGVPPESTLYRHVLRQGRWFRADESDVAVLSAELADRERVRVGDNVEIQARGQHRSFTVVGVAVDNTIFLGGTLAGKAYLPRSALGRLLGREDRVSLFALGLHNRERSAVDRALTEIERQFRRWQPSVQPVYAEVESAQEASRLLTLALVARVVIVALVGYLSIVNTCTLNVLERRREIAVIRALGGDDGAILLVFLVEGLLLGSAGWLLGVALGYPTARLFTAQLSRVLFVLDFRLPLAALAMSLAFTLGLTTLAILGPALGAAHTSAAMGLRYE